MLIVHVDERCAAMFEDVVKGSALFSSYTLEIFEELEMLTTNVRAACMCRFADLTQPGDLARVVRPDLEHSHVMAVPKLEQHLRQTDLIVVIRFGLQHSARCAKHVR